MVLPLLRGALVFLFIASVAWHPSLLSIRVAYLVATAPVLTSVTVRRLRDVDRSSRMTVLVLGFLPFADGPRPTRILMQPGTGGPNRYSSDPLRPEVGFAPTRGRRTVPRRRSEAEKPACSSGHGCLRCGWRGQSGAAFCTDCGATF